VEREKANSLLALLYAGRVTWITIISHEEPVVMTFATVARMGAATLCFGNEREKANLQTVVVVAVGTTTYTQKRGREPRVCRNCAGWGRQKEGDWMEVESGD
jgi:hypothetical protein